MQISSSDNISKSSSELVPPKESLVIPTAIQILKRNSSEGSLHSLSKRVRHEVTLSDLVQKLLNCPYTDDIFDLADFLRIHLKSQDVTLFLENVRNELAGAIQKDISIQNVMAVLFILNDVLNERDFLSFFNDLLNFHVEYLFEVLQMIQEKNSLDPLVLAFLKHPQSQKIRSKEILKVALTVHSIPREEALLLHNIFLKMANEKNTFEFQEIKEILKLIPLLYTLLDESDLTHFLFTFLEWMAAHSQDRFDTFSKHLLKFVNHVTIVPPGLEAKLLHLLKTTDSKHLTKTKILQTLCFFAAREKLLSILAKDEEAIALLVLKILKVDPVEVWIGENLLRILLPMRTWQPELFFKILIAKIDLQPEIRWILLPFLQFQTKQFNCSSKFLKNEICLHLTNDLNNFVIRFENFPFHKSHHFDSNTSFHLEACIVTLASLSIKNHTTVKKCLKILFNIFRSSLFFPCFEVRNVLDNFLERSQKYPFSVKEAWFFLNLYKYIPFPPLNLLIQPTLVILNHHKSEKKLLALFAFFKIVQHHDDFPFFWKEIEPALTKSLNRDFNKSREFEILFWKFLSFLTIKKVPFSIDFLNCLIQLAIRSQLLPIFFIGLFSNLLNENDYISFLEKFLENLVVPSEEEIPVLFSFRNLPNLTRKINFVFHHFMNNIEINQESCDLFLQGHHLFLLSVLGENAPENTLDLTDSNSTDYYLVEDHYVSSLFTACNYASANNAIDTLILLLDSKKLSFQDSQIGTLMNYIFSFENPFILLKILKFRNLFAITPELAQQLLKSLNSNDQNQMVAFCNYLVNMERTVEFVLELGKLIADLEVQLEPIHLPFFEKILFFSREGQVRPFTLNQRKTIGWALSQFHQKNLPIPPHWFRIFEPPSALLKKNFF